MFTVPLIGQNGKPA